MFEKLETLPPDPILGVSVAYREDPSPDKVDLSVGVYRNKEGITPVMAAIWEAERALVDAGASKAYLPPAGSLGFRQSIAALALGPALPAVRERVAVIQAPGGCGALRLGAELVQRAKPGATISLGEPTWPNHLPLLSGGGLAVTRHPYYDPATRELRLDAMLESLDAAPADSLVLLQACCHNPTGLDPDQEQWRQILDVLRRRKLVPFFDLAYQGLADDPDTDAWAVREALSTFPEMILAVSCSKNFGLYRERVGALIVLGGDASRAKAIETQANKAARSMYSMPPAHGALLVERILADTQLTATWREELATMAKRLRSLREALATEIAAAKPGFDASWIARQRGLFSLLGVGPDVVTELREKHHIYMGLDSRANIAGLRESNVARVAGLVAPHLK